MSLKLQVAVHELESRVAVLEYKMEEFLGADITEAAKKQVELQKEAIKSFSTGHQTNKKKK